MFLSYCDTNASVFNQDYIKNQDFFVLFFDSEGHIEIA